VCASLAVSGAPLGSEESTLETHELLIGVFGGAFFATLLAIHILCDGRTGRAMRRKGVLRD
jgi:hypothetical protein